MKFCLINNLFPPLSVGGAEKIVQIISQGLTNYGKVLVISLNNQSQDSVEERSNLKIFRLAANNFQNYLGLNQLNLVQKGLWHLFDLYNRALALKVKQILVKEKPDLAFTHNLKGLSYQLPNLLNDLNIPFAHTLHDYQLLDPHGSLFRGLKPVSGNSLPLKLYRLLSKNLFNKVRSVISPSAFVLKKHQQFGFFKQSENLILPNPVMISSQPLVKKSQPDQKLRLLFLGQVEVHKGINFLIETFNQLTSDSFELWTAGNGSLLPRLKASNHNPNLRFLGKVNYDQLPDLFSQVDLTVVPSLWWENSPTVIYESYAAATPVLVSDSGGAKELVREGETGFIFKSGDKGSLLLVLDKILQNRQNLTKFGLSGRELVEQFTVDGYLAKLLKLCRI